MNSFIRELEEIAMLAKNKNLDKVLNGLLTDPSIIENKVPVTDSASYASYHQSVNENEHVIEVPLVGIEKENVKVEVDNKVLTVTASTNEKSRFIRNFKQSWSVAENAQLDELKAELKNGLLRIVIPKPKKNILRKTIVIN